MKMVNSRTSGLGRALWVAALLGTSAIATGGMAGTAMAQSTAAARIDIPAQPLDAAIRALMRATGTQITYPGSLSEGRTSAAVSNANGAAEALSRLLAGTGLTFRQTGPRAYTLEPAPQASAETVTLGAVRVEGEGGGDVIASLTSDPSATEGSTSYAMLKPSSTATKMGLTVRETPQSVSVVTRQQIDDLALTDLSQVLDRVPGITVGRNDSERFTFYSRGFEVENVQFDGVPNTVDAASQYTTTLADSAVYDRVEVVKGASGLLSGAGYPSAVLNLVRKRPTREFQASVEASAGSWDRYREVVDISAPLTAGGAVRARVVGALQNADSYIDYYSRNTRNLYGIVEADLASRTTLAVGVDYMKTMADGSSFGHIPLFYSDGTRTHFRRSLNPAARWTYWNNETTNIFASLKHEWGEDWKLDLSVSHLRQTRDALFGSAYFGQVDKETGLGIRMLSGYIPNQATTNAVNLALTGGFQLFGRRHELMLNGTFSRQNRDSQNYGSIFSDVGDYFDWGGNVAQPGFTKQSDRKTRTTEKGVAAAVRLRPTDALSIIGGARLSWYDLYDANRYVADGSLSVSDDLSIKGKVTPYAGIVYDVLPQWSLYASYTDIFRPQTYYKYASGSPLAPLTGRSLEAGIKGALLDEQLNVSLAVFHIKQNNYAQADGGFTPQGDESYVAVQGITSKGVELEVSGSVTPDWNVYGGYTYRTSSMPAQPDVILSAVNTNQPRHLAKLSTTYRLPAALSRMTVGGSISWQSSTYYQQSGTPYYRADQPGYALVGLMVRYAFDNGLSLSGNINNLFDKTYMPGLGSYGTGVYGDPRSFLVTAKYQF